MDEDRLPLSERLLIVLHNLSAINSEVAKRPEELAQILQASAEEVDQILDRHVSEGYAMSFTASDGMRRYYLTGVGIIRACSFFS